MNHRMGAMTLLLLAGLAAAGAAMGANADTPLERVVLLHGLGRHAGSMSRMAAGLTRAGFDVCNIDYASLDLTIEEIANERVLPAVAQCWPQSPRRIHFVTHSLGGILVRQLVANGDLPNIGRVVMLGPPNQGSELADTLARLSLLDGLRPPAAGQLMTSAASLPQQLGPATFELGVLIGDRSVNPVLSLLIPGRDDGKVAVAAAELAGMKDSRVLHTSHTFIMRRRVVIAQTVCFLRSGAFAEEQAMTACDPWRR